MTLSIPCPGCREPLDVDPEYRTWKVRCPRCETEFIPDDRLRPTAPPADDPPPRRRRRDDDDDDDYRPRRRRRRFTRATYDRAAADAHAPGLCLEVLGWLSVLGSLGLVALFVMIGAAVNQPGAPRNNNNGPDDAAVMMILGTCVGVFGLPYGLVLATAGRRLRNLSGRGWATTGAALGIGGFVLFGLFGFPHLGAGIWALVVLNRPHVAAAFDYVARYGGPPEPDDDGPDDDF